MKIAVLGLGFIGSKLAKRLSEDHEVTGITRENYAAASLLGAEYDVFINCAGNSKKYMAARDPKWDFQENCISTFNTLYDFKFKRYIFLSTLDVYKESIYARSKTVAESILVNYQRELKFELTILRSSFITGKDKDKGIVYDILHGQPLGISKESKFQIITVCGIGDFIESILPIHNPVMTFNITGHPALSMAEIETILGKEGIYKENAPTHVYDYDVSGARAWCKIKTSEEYLRESLVE